MKVTQKQLNELIYLITRGVVKEYGSMTSSQEDDMDSGVADDGDKPDDAQTAYEKSKAEREARKNKQDQVRTATMDLDSTKKQQSYFNSQTKQNKTAIQAKERKLQLLKGAQGANVITAGGTIAEMVRKHLSKI